MCEQSVILKAKYPIPKQKRELLSAHQGSDHRLHRAYRATELNMFYNPLLSTGDVQKWNLFLMHSSGMHPGLVRFLENKTPWKRANHPLRPGRRRQDVERLQFMGQANLIAAMRWPLLPQTALHLCKDTGQSVPFPALERKKKLWISFPQSNLLEEATGLSTSVFCQNQDLMVK